MSKMVEINIYIFGIPQNLFEKLFPNKRNNKNDFIIEERFKLIEKQLDIHQCNSKVPLIICAFLKNKIYYNAYKYTELLDNNYNKILFNLYNTIKNSKNKNTLIIKFGNSFIKEFAKFMKLFKNNQPFILFILDKDQINNDLFKNFEEPQYISYIENTQNNNNINSFERLKSKINDFIWTKICYFFDLGKSPCHFFYPDGFLEYNILLLGQSRAGKSTFINRIYNKLVSHEGADLSSVTKNVKEYKIYLQNSKLGINILDSPGIVTRKDFEVVKKELEHHINKIHLIYFFIKSQSNLEENIDVLKYIQNNNIKIAKNGKYKIPIIFIKNGEDLDLNNKNPKIFQLLKEELKKNKLLELYDSSINIINKINDKEINEDNFLDDNLDIPVNYDQYVEGNIIQIHLPTGKNINNIFKLSKEYLLKYNKFILEEDIEGYRKLKENVTKLIKFFIKQEFKKQKLSRAELQEKNELYQKSNDFVKKIRSKNSMLYNSNILEIRGYYNNNKESLYFTLVSIPMFIGLPLPVFFTKFIQESYDYFCNFISETAIQFGFDNKDINDYGLFNYLIQFSKEYNKEANTIKFNSQIMEYFGKIIEYIGPSQCLIKAKQLSRQILELFNYLENKKNWVSFEIEKI